MKSNQKHNLFILRSPLQVINAIEAIEYFNLTNNILVIVYNSLESNTHQIKSLTQEYPLWDTIIELEDNNKKSKFFRYVKLIKQLKKIDFNYVFFGNFGSIQKGIIANIRKNYVYLLDDGTSTIKIYEHFLKTNKLNTFSFREIRFLIFGLQFRLKDTINLFTYFNLKSDGKNKIVKNELENFRKKYLSAKPTQDIYFIGQPLDTVMQLNIYLDVLRNIVHTYNQKVIYIPHRAESKELISSVASISPMLELKYIDVPVEIFFIKEHIEPARIFSFYSTALTTLSFILKNTDLKHIEIRREDMTDFPYYDNILSKYYQHVDPSDKIAIEKFL